MDRLARTRPQTMNRRERKDQAASDCSRNPSTGGKNVTYHTPDHDYALRVAVIGHFNGAAPSRARKILTRTSQNREYRTASMEPRDVSVVLPVLRASQYKTIKK